MGKEINPDFCELFGGASTSAESLNADVSALALRQPVALSLDSDFYDFESMTPSSFATKQLMDQDFVKQISGVEPVALAPAVSPGLELLKSVQLFNQRRAAEIAKRSPHRRRRIEQIIEQARQHAPNSIRNSGGWDRLIDSCAQYVTSAILAEI